MAQIRDTIVRQPITTRPSTSIRDAAREMERQGVGALLVVEDDRLVGIVTDRDIVLRGVARDVAADGRIDALMTTEVITLPSGADIERAYEVFRDHAIRRLPIVDGRRLVGLLSIDDLLVRTEHEIAELVHPLADEIFAPHREAPPLVAPATATPSLSARRRAMRARPGDILVIHRHTAGQPDRLGEISEVRSPAGDPPFTVRWDDRGHTGDLSAELMEQACVGLDSCASSHGLGQAVPGKVYRQDAARRRQQRCEREPVEMRSTETVHADQQRAARRAAEVDIVHRAVQIDPARHGVSGASGVKKAGLLMPDGR